MPNDVSLLAEQLPPAEELGRFLDFAGFVDNAAWAAAYFCPVGEDIALTETVLRNEVVEHTEKTVYAVVPPPVLPWDGVRPRQEVAAAVERYFAPDFKRDDVLPQVVDVSGKEPIKTGLVISPGEENFLPSLVEERLAEKICAKVEARLKARVMGAGGRFGR